MRIVQTEWLNKFLILDTYMVVAYSISKNYLENEDNGIHSYNLKLIIIIVPQYFHFSDLS